MERYGENEVLFYAEDPEADETTTYQWQYSLDNEYWYDAEGANSIEYMVKLDETNTNSYWRLVITRKTPETDDDTHPNDEIQPADDTQPMADTNIPEETTIPDVSQLTDIPG